MNKIIVLFAVLAVLNLIANKIKSKKLEIATKFILMPTLYLSSGLMAESRLLVAVCALYTLGDVLLLFPPFAMFVLGAVSFAMGHLLFCVYFAINYITSPVAIVAGLVAGAALMLYWYKSIYSDDENKTLHHEQFAYILFVDTLFAFSVATGSSVVALGGFFYVFSDMFIVREQNKLVKPNSPLVMATYMAANLFLLWGITLMA
jgi:YhhN-like protein.